MVNSTNYKAPHFAVSCILLLCHTWAQIFSTAPCSQTSQCVVVLYDKTNKMHFLVGVVIQFITMHGQYNIKSQSVLLLCCRYQVSYSYKTADKIVIFLYLIFGSSDGKQEDKKSRCIAGIPET